VIEKTEKFEYEDDLIQLGVRFKTIREKLNLKQRELAEALGISSSYLSEIEKDKKRPGFNILLKLFDRYKINLNWLIANEGELFCDSLQTDPLLTVDFGDQMPRFREMVKYMSLSPFFLSYMMSQFIKAYNENETTILMDINKKKTGERK
jgi:transcriptional regulator with XRE-family HTH domain